MKWLKLIGIALGVTVLILAVVPFFISLDDYMPVIEREVSARLKVPMAIGQPVLVTGLGVKGAVGRNPVRKERGQ